MAEEEGGERGGEEKGGGEGGEEKGGICNSTNWY